MSSKRPPYGGQNSHIPEGICRKTASTACVPTQAKNQTVFLPGKTALILLAGDIPWPLSLAPFMEHQIRAGNGMRVHRRTPYGGIHEREVFYGNKDKKKRTESISQR